MWIEKEKSPSTDTKSLEIETGRLNKEINYLGKIMETFTEGKKKI